MCLRIEVSRLCSTCRLGPRMTGLTLVLHCYFSRRAVVIQGILDMVDDDRGRDSSHDLQDEHKKRQGQSSLSPDGPLFHSAPSPSRTIADRFPYTSSLSLSSPFSFPNRPPIDALQATLDQTPQSPTSSRVRHAVDAPAQHDQLPCVFGSGDWGPGPDPRERGQ